MLLQRLIVDREGGLNYDYMGASEYEYGAIAHGRTTFAQAYLDGNIVAKRVKFVELIVPFRGNGQSRAAIDVVLFSVPEVIATLGDTFTAQVTKEHFRTDDPKIVGWIHVGWPDTENHKRKPLTPLLIVRADPDMIAKVDCFFKNPIDYLEGQKAAVNATGFDTTQSIPWQNGWKDQMNQLSESILSDVGCARCGHLENGHIDRIDARPGECDSYVSR